MQITLAHVPQFAISVLADPVLYRNGTEEFRDVKEQVFPRERTSAKPEWVRVLSSMKDKLKDGCGPA